MVRIGRDNDGGYVVSARALDATRVLVALGINDDWSFEADFAHRVSMLAIVAVDGSMSVEIFRRRARSDLKRAAGYAVSLRRWATLDALRWARRWWRTAREFHAFLSTPSRIFIHQ